MLSFPLKVLIFVAPVVSSICVMARHDAKKRKRIKEKEDAEKAMQESTHVINTLSQQVHSLKLQLAETRKEAESESAKNASLIGELSKSHHDLANTQNMNTSLKSQLHQSAKELKEARAECETNKRLLNLANEELDLLKSNNKEQEGLFLSERLKKLTHELGIAHHELELLKTDNTDLHNLLEKVKNERFAAKFEVENLKVMLRKAQEEQEAVSIAADKDCIINLKRQVDYYKTQNERRIQSSSDTYQLYIDKKHEVQELKRENKRLQSLNNTLEKFVDDMKKEIDLMHLESILQENKELKARIQDAMKVNKAQAIALREMERKEEMTKRKRKNPIDEFEPSNEDLEYISRHIEILLEDRDDRW